MSFEYHIVTAAGVEEASAKVKLYVERGWKLLGGVSTLALGGVIYYSQALYKEEKKNGHTN